MYFWCPPKDPFHLFLLKADGKHKSGTGAILGIVFSRILNYLDNSCNCSPLNRQCPLQAAGEHFLPGTFGLPGLKPSNVRLELITSRQPICLGQLQGVVSGERPGDLHARHRGAGSRQGRGSPVFGSEWFWGSNQSCWVWFLGGETIALSEGLAFENQVWHLKTVVTDW